MGRAAKVMQAKLPEEPAHSDLGPSGADRWMDCTASVEHNRKHGVQSSSDAAEEGTLAHEVFESDLLAALRAMGIKARRYRPDEGSLLADPEVVGKYDLDQISEDIADVVERVMDEVRVSLDGVQVWVEEKIHLGRMTSAVWGTLDCAIWQPALDRLTVVDLKYGRWEVSPERNRQETIYAMGALASLLKLRRVPSDIRLVICQPRIGRTWNTWTMPAGYLEQEFIPAFKKALADIESGNVTWSPGDKACRFCAGAAKCPALFKKAQEVQQGMFSDMDDAGNLAQSLELASVLESWIGKVRESATRKLRDGGSVPGWKLVEGRSSRKWTDQDQVIEVLRGAGLRVKDITETKLLGIPAIEKVIKGNKKLDRDIVSGYIMRSPGRATLAPESDKRPAIGQVFENLETEGN